VDEFVRAVKLRFPKALVQWEDLTPPNATTLLERYRSELPSFNDDIQGTAALVLAGILAAGRATGTKLAEQRIVVAGAGPAGIGIARLVRRALEGEGLTGEALRGAVALLDADGLLVDSTDETVRELSWPAELAVARGLSAGSSLAAVVRAFEPTSLVGVSGAPGLFGEEVVREMARHVKRPVILPLSSPPEASPADLRAFSDGRALVAIADAADAGDGEVSGVARGHTGFVFPGVGLGVLVSEAREVTDGMLAAAATALAEHVSEEDLGDGKLLPPIRDLRAVAARVAEAVVRQATREDAARNPPKRPAEAVAAAMWEPAYPVVEVS
jgi:malate dehydrogenase (oxaloacetate-decarboxylating)